MRTDRAMGVFLDTGAGGSVASSPPGGGRGPASGDGAAETRGSCVLQKRKQAQRGHATPLKLHSVRWGLEPGAWDPPPRLREPLAGWGACGVFETGVGKDSKDGMWSHPGQPGGGAGGTAGDTRLRRPRRVRVCPSPRLLPGVLAGHRLVLGNRALLVVGPRAPCRGAGACRPRGHCDGRTRMHVTLGTQGCQVLQCPFSQQAEQEGSPWDGHRWVEVGPGEAPTWGTRPDPTPRDPLPRSFRKAQLMSQTQAHVCCVVPRLRCLHTGGAQYVSGPFSPHMGPRKTSVPTSRPGEGDVFVGGLLRVGRSWAPDTQRTHIVKASEASWV